MHVKEKASEANAKNAGGGGVSKQSKQEE